MVLLKFLFMTCRRKIYNSASEYVHECREFLAGIMEGGEEEEEQVELLPYQDYLLKKIKRKYSIRVGARRRRMGASTTKKTTRKLHLQPLDEEGGQGTCSGSRCPKRI